jgi:hypothetical protein
MLSVVFKGNTVLTISGEDLDPTLSALQTAMDVKGVLNVKLPDSIDGRRRIVINTNNVCYAMLEEEQSVQKLVGEYNTVWRCSKCSAVNTPSACRACGTTREVER